MTNPPEVLLGQAKLNIPKSKFSHDKQGVSSCTRNASRVTGQIDSQKKPSQPLSQLVGTETGGIKYKWHVKCWPRRQNPFARLWQSLEAFNNQERLGSRKFATSTTALFDTLPWHSIVCLFLHPVSVHCVLITC